MRFVPIVGVLLIAYSFQSMAQEVTGKSNSLRITVNGDEAEKKEIKPTVKWIYPQDNQEVLEEVDNIFKLGINSKSPLKKVTLILNDEVIESFENFGTNDSSGYLFDAWIEQSINLNPGTNNIVLIVQNELGALQHKRKLEVKVKPAARKNYALIIGIDEYNAWNNLDGPIRDAEKIAMELESKGFEINLLRDASTFDILDKLEELAHINYGPHDQLLIYFAGYGFYDATTGTGHLVCKNSVKQATANVTYLSYEVVQNIANNIPVPHVLLVLDAVKGKGEVLPLAANHEISTTDTTSDFNNGKTTRIGILSGMEDYRWNQAYAEGSPLSTALLTYLKKADSEVLSWLDLLKEVEKVQPKPIYVEFGDHEPGSGFSLQPRGGR